MRRILLFVSLIMAFIFLPGLANSAVIIAPANVLPEEKPNISSLTVKDVQQLIGRKLTLKEKIAFFVLKKKLTKTQNTDAGQTALVFGIAGLVLLILGLFLPYVILGSIVSAIIAVVLGSAAKKKDPHDTKASSAVLLGWITLGAIALLLILIAAILSSIHWY